jgi:hypothetical protein
VDRFAAAAHFWLFFYLLLSIFIYKATRLLQFSDFKQFNDTFTIFISYALKTKCRIIHTKERTNKYRLMRKLKSCSWKVNKISSSTVKRYCYFKKLLVQNRTWTCCLGRNISSVGRGKLFK